jgi:hypothetical protein
MPNPFHGGLVLAFWYAPSALSPTQRVTCHPFSAVSDPEDGHFSQAIDNYLPVSHLR